jgi:protoporphyrinogen oxidase
MRRRWCVVGGGMLGLDIARQIAGWGDAVTVWESADQLGGLAAPWRIGNVVWDRFYHVIAGSDSLLIDLLHAIGLESDVNWVKAQTGFYTDRRLHPFSSVKDFAFFPALTPVQKARLAASILYASRVNDWHGLEEITAVEWLTRLSGRQVVDRIWLPLLRAKLGENAERVSAAFIWTIIKRMYGARQSSNKQECFGFVPGGYARILAELIDHLLGCNVDLQTQRSVTSIERIADGRIAVRDSQGSCEFFDEVVVTVPAGYAARICPQLTAEEKQRLTAIEYQGVICASLLLKRPLSPYYITNITDPAPFTAVIEMDALTGTAAFDGSALVYLPKYVTSSDALFDQDENALREMFVDGLRAMYPDLSTSEIVAARVAKARFVLPLSTLGYSKRVPSFVSSIPGTYIVNSTQIVNGTLNVNQTLMLARDAIKAIESDLAARSQMLVEVCA